MIASRLLVIVECADAAVAQGTIRRALASAVRPLGLRFAVPASLAPALRALDDNTSLLFYDDALGLNALPELLTDETHFLLLSGPYAFGPR